MFFCRRLSRTAHGSSAMNKENAAKQRRNIRAVRTCVVHPARPGAVVSNTMKGSHGAERDDRRLRALFNLFHLITSPPERISEVPEPQEKIRRHQNPGKKHVGRVACQQETSLVYAFRSRRRQIAALLHAGTYIDICTPLQVHAERLKAGFGQVLLSAPL